MADYIKPVVFKLNDQMFGVDINLVQAIEKQINVVPVPNSLEYISGIINLRGEIVPVYNLKKKFNIAGRENSENSIIIKTGKVTIALEVDTVLEISDIEREKIVSMPKMLKTKDCEYLDRVANVDGKLVILLDVNHLLTDDEADTVKKIAEDIK